jgi:hypothetical protein
VKIRAILGALILLVSGQVNAAIISYGSWTTDTDTGLDWLDVTASVNWSFTDISLEFGNGGEFQGWRHATGDEFNTLVGNFTGNPVTSYGYVNQEEDLTDGLIVLLGSTLDSFHLHYNGSTYDAIHGEAEGDYYDFTSGFIADTDVNGEQYLAFLDDPDWWFGFFDRSHAHHQTLSRDYSEYSQGHFLVRVSPIPIPASIWLFGTGILGLIGFSKRRKPA